MEKVIINFSKHDLGGDYSNMIIESVKNHLFWNRNIVYEFPQIEKWWIELKNKVASLLKELNIKWEFNVWFMSSKTKEAVFKIIINK